MDLCFSTLIMGMLSAEHRELSGTSSVNSTNGQLEHTDRTPPPNENDGASLVNSIPTSQLQNSRISPPCSSRRTQPSQVKGVGVTGSEGRRHTVWSFWQSLCPWRVEGTVVGVMVYADSVEVVANATISDPATDFLYELILVDTSFRVSGTFECTHSNSL